MEKLRQAIKKMANSIQDKQAKGSQKAFMEELFNDYYLRRHDVYKMNFFRGIFFGLGSVLGGTIVVALIVWILSFFVSAPLIGEYLEGVQQSIESPEQR